MVREVKLAWDEERPLPWELRPRDWDPQLEESPDPDPRRRRRQPLKKPSSDPRRAPPSDSA